MKTVCIIQARMLSSRMPGKVLLPLPTGQSVLEEVVGRCLNIRGVDKVVVAIPDLGIDDLLLPFIPRAADVFRGPHEDVLARYHQAAMAYSASTIMRVTADCPLLNPEVCENVLRTYENGDFDFCSNTVPRTFPRGLDCEVFSWQLLDFTHKSAVSPQDREHVTLWMLNGWMRASFKIEGIQAKADYSHFQWSLDTPEDYRTICRVLGRDSAQIAATQEGAGRPASSSG